jgi:hypothetical protein
MRGQRIPGSRPSHPAAYHGWAHKGRNAGGSTWAARNAESRSRWAEMPPGQWYQRCHNGLGTCSRASVTELGEPGGARGDAPPGCRPYAAKVASEQCSEHPWRAESHAAAKLLRPRSIGKLFGEDGLAHRHDLVDEAPMEPAVASGSG